MAVEHRMSVLVILDVRKQPVQAVALLAAALCIEIIRDLACVILIYAAVNAVPDAVRKSGCSSAVREAAVNGCSGENSLSASDSS